MVTSRLTTAGLADLAGDWALDPARSSIVFHTKAMWILPAKGAVKALEGGGSLGADGSLTGTLVIDAASIDTKNAKRDAHLRTADFFEVAKYPTITFRATGGRVLASGDFEVTGELTVHGKTRPITFVTQVEASVGTLRVSGEVEIDRSQFGLTLRPFGAGLKNRVALDLTFTRVR